MKRTALAAALFAAVTAPAAFAQASDIPKMKCEPVPEFPGRLASDTRRKVFDRDMKAYKDCVSKYIEDRKASIKANDAAANAAVDEHNAVMKKITDEQATAK